MKALRLIVGLIIALTLASTASAEVKGWGLGAGVFHGDFGVQLRKDFWLGGDISQITGQGSVYFPGKTTFRVDIDYHFVINPKDPGRFYPLAGVDFAFNSDAFKVGINGGVGVNFMITQSLAAFGEAKYVFGKWDGWAFTAGIYI